VSRRLRAAVVGTLFVVQMFTAIVGKTITKGFNPSQPAQTPLSPVLEPSG
jgi:hypothetical protein